MSIRTAPGFVECGGCANVLRVSSPHDSDEGRGICLRHVGEEQDAAGRGIAKYQLVRMSMPDGFDQLNPWSDRNPRLEVGGCFEGVPMDWDTVAARPDDYLDRHDLKDD